MPCHVHVVINKIHVVIHVTLFYGKMCTCVLLLLSESNVMLC